MFSTILIFFLLLSPRFFFLPPLLFFRSLLSSFLLPTFFLLFLHRPFLFIFPLSSTSLSHPLTCSSPSLFYVPLLFLPLGCFSSCRYLFLYILLPFLLTLTRPAPSCASLPPANHVFSVLLHTPCFFPFNIVPCFCLPVFFLLVRTSASLPPADPVCTLLPLSTLLPSENIISFSALFFQRNLTFPNLCVTASFLFRLSSLYLHTPLFLMSTSLYS